MIGVAIITCNREDMYRVCIDSIHDDWYDELVTVNDGEAVRYTKGEYIETGGGVGVGMAKNTAMQHLLDKGCDYIILVEDDMRFKKDIFKYTNAFEHVDHSYMLAKKGYSTPYWWWSDLANSLDYVEEQKCSEESSAIRPRSDWQSNIQQAAKHFISKHGISPVSVGDTSVKEVILNLKKIKSAV